MATELAARTTWHDVPSLRAVWTGAPSSDQRLTDLLAQGREWVELNATQKLAEGVTTIPTRFAEAQYLYARYVYEKARLNPDSDEIGLPGYTTPSGLNLGRIRGTLNPDPTILIG